MAGHSMGKATIGIAWNVVNARDCIVHGKDDCMSCAMAWRTTRTKHRAWMGGHWGTYCIVVLGRHRSMPWTGWWPSPCIIADAMAKPPILRPKTVSLAALGDSH